MTNKTYESEEEYCNNIPEITSENISDMILFYYNEAKQFQIDKSNDGFFERLWKCIVAHTGRQPFYNGEICPFNSACGPCPGFCLNSRDEVFTAVSDDYLLSRSAYDDGERMFQAALFNDSIMGLNFLQMNFTAADNNLYVTEDFSIGSRAAAVFGKSDIIILEGVYPVSFASSKHGTTLVKVLSY